MDTGEAKPIGSSVTHEVHGISQIFVKDSKKMIHPSSLHYSNGFIKLGNKTENLKSIDATVLCFSSTEIAKTLYEKLAKFDHPGVIEAFTYGVGEGNHSNNSFLAVTKFETTFEGYLRRECQLATDQQNRFTENFINLLRDIILAMEELHRQGYFCPKLDGSHIAIINEGSSQRARFWMFGKIKADTEENMSNAKDNDWYRLGGKIGNVSLTPESRDLFVRINRRELKGRNILKHYALLTVREKFENILSLNQHISLNLKEPQMESGYLDASNLSVETLEGNLDKVYNWNNPPFIGAASQTKTLRGFIYFLRTIIEHEVLYLTPELLAEAEGILKDLEHYFQKEWEVVYLKLQQIAVQLRLKY